MANHATHPTSPATNTINEREHGAMAAFLMFGPQHGSGSGGTPIALFLLPLLAIALLAARRYGQRKQY
jgi:MYXO-CTERM domain-containing protein